MELFPYRSVLFHMKNGVCLKYFAYGCLCKQIFASNSPQVSLNLICVTIVVTLRPLTHF